MAYKIIKQKLFNVINLNLSKHINVFSYPSMLLSEAKFCSYTLVFTAILWAIILQVKFIPLLKAINLQARKDFAFYQREQQFWLAGDCLSSLGRRFLFYTVLVTERGPRITSQYFPGNADLQRWQKVTVSLTHPSVHTIFPWSMWTSVSWVRRTQLEKKNENISLMGVTALLSKITADKTWSGSR